MASLKCLFVSPASAAYGSERSMLALLRAREFDAEVVCPGGGALGAELERLGVPVHPLEFGKYSLRQNPLWHFDFYRRFHNILKSVRPDVLVINLDGNTPWVTLAAALAKVPVVRFCRFEFKPPTRWLDRWCWVQAQAIICPSEWVAQQVREWLPPEFRQRVHCFHDAFAGHLAAPEDVADFRQELGLGNSRLVGCVGRMHRGKRIEVAIEAFALLRKAMGDVRLVIIGSDDGSPAGMVYFQDLKQIATNLGVSEAIVFAGYRPADTMPAAMAALDVCVLPSESESFGMVLMEAWAQGVPTLASDVAGCGEITRASGGGLLAPVGDAVAFARNLRALLSDSERSEAMGLRGKAWVEKTCTPAGYANRFNAVIEPLKLIENE